ncbi:MULTISPECIES: family 2 encapsulin nanocompartment cargo protein polyprenyl transferase [unclassified Amycolatopsis]|uniref:family 2 encapsulin nanocompartment cargo protein polyprenyl transferase n=1 Tax=unclassified Amycolatopsis TaxID=2618356 RepID=UPI00287437FA|nr:MULTISPECIES: family 2 encapsulin nanocompartment cargo protein polyprenyl transferase [unclassified Amycolatopsis]MDS0139354.1 polyprenyl synthetase family protein [Amycolatopsis sp. 505]MDS0144586.1 polyprenyl synthetase family protein [Amycolatopsis sp. CM201R]
MTTMNTRTAARPLADVLAWSKGLVEPALRTAAERLPEAMRRIAAYHFGWQDAAGRPAAGDGGKALRPALVLLCAEAAGGEAADAVPAAVAVELVHNFSLLHDDVMDGDTTRRHRATAWTVFGTGPAVLAGDALLSLAFEVLAPSGAANAKVLSAATLALLEGQAADLDFEQRDDVTPTECVRMAEGKTAALLGASCTLGAAFGTAGADRFGAFGRAVGLAFQHIDDLLGIWGDPAVTGKPVYSDLQNRKKSLPVVTALCSGTPAGADLATLYARRDPLDESDLARAASLVDAAGGRQWSQAQAEALLAKALRDLTTAAPPSRATAELATLARLITTRTH